MNNELEEEDGLPIGYAEWYNRKFKACAADTKRDHLCEDAWRAALGLVAAKSAVGWSAEDACEQFIAAEIDSAPEPLRRLGEYLTDLLDDDHFRTADRLLLAIAAETSTAVRNAAKPAAPDDPRSQSKNAEEVAQWLYASGHREAAATIRNQLDLRNARITKLERELAAAGVPSPSNQTHADVVREAADLIARLAKYSEAGNELPVTWRLPLVDELRGIASMLAAQPAPDAVATLPFDEDVQEILGRMCFQCISIANAFRAADVEIEKRAEAEQAFVIHWLLCKYLQHGKNWRAEARDELKEMSTHGRAGEE